MSLLGKLFGKKDDAATEVNAREAKRPEVPAAAETLPMAEPAPEVSQPLVGTAMPTPVANPLPLPEAAPEELPAIKTGAGAEETEEEAPARVAVLTMPRRSPGPQSVEGQRGQVGTAEVEEQGPEQPQQLTIEQMRTDPNFVRVFDQYGQEVFLTRQQWREEILPGSLQANWDAPEELYGIILNAMNDGLFAEVEEATARLHAIDTNPVRGTCLRAIVLLQLGRVDESERVLEAYRAQFGEDGAVLTNLAKVYATRGETERAKETLWRAIELDPNLENGLGWFLAGEFESGGEEGRQRGLARVAALPGSWRARLWLAKAALDGGDLGRALALYGEGLSLFPGPVPTEFLYPMSGDLGMSGHLRELIDLTEPRFLPEVHGLTVGNNLIKAHVDLGELEPAAAIVNRLFAMKRPDWRETLGFWEGAIARARQAAVPRDPGAQLEIGMLEMIGPVWKRAGGPLTEVFGDKPETAPVVTIVGGTAEFTPPEGPQGMQLADALGRLSRAFPLFLAEQLEFNTAARVRTLLPRVTAGGSGFVLRGGEWTDAEALESAFEAELTPTYLLKAHLDARAADWILKVTILRASDSASLGAVQATFPAGRPEVAVIALARELVNKLGQDGLQTETPSPLYRLPEEQALANYMIRLEQLLAVRSAIPVGDEPPPITGERDILEGTLFLALQQPGSAAARALLAAMVVAMRRIRPDIVEEVAERVVMLQRDRPLGEPFDEIVLGMVED